MADAFTATMQWHDRFDQAFGVTASDCCDLLDWPGKTTPDGAAAISAMTGHSDTDWEFSNRFRGQIKVDIYKKELIEANPRLAALAEAKVIFLMRSIGDTRIMPDVSEGGVVVADALWLSFASFCSETLFATFPQPGEENADDKRMRLVLHFALRSLLYRHILLGQPVDRARYSLIWDTWPERWDNFDGAVFLWTGLGRFVIAHELAHLLHHAPANCTVEAAIERGIVPAHWIETWLSEAPRAELETYLYEVEADFDALVMCENMLAEYPDLAFILRAGLYYMFLCLEELSRRIGAESVFPQRRACIGAFLATLEGGPTIRDHVEDQFRQRAKFYFDISDEFAPLVAAP